MYINHMFGHILFIEVVDATSCIRTSHLSEPIVSPAWFRSLMFHFINKIHDISFSKYLNIDKTVCHIPMKIIWSLSDLSSLQWLPLVKSQDLLELMKYTIQVPVSLIHHCLTSTKIFYLLKA